MLKQQRSVCLKHMPLYTTDGWIKQHEHFYFDAKFVFKMKMLPKSGWHQWIQNNKQAWENISFFTVMEYHVNGKLEQSSDDQ